MADASPTVRLVSGSTSLFVAACLVYPFIALATYLVVGSFNIGAWSTPMGLLWIGALGGVTFFFTGVFEQRWTRVFAPSSPPRSVLPLELGRVA